jgi:hypothetical protein
MATINKQLSRYYENALLNMATKKLVYKEFGKHYDEVKPNLISRIKTNISYWRYKIGSWIAGGFDEDW